MISYILYFIIFFNYTITKLLKYMNSIAFSFRVNNNYLCKSEYFFTWILKFHYRQCQFSFEFGHILQFIIQITYKVYQIKYIAICSVCTTTLFTIIYGIYMKT